MQPLVYTYRNTKCDLDKVLGSLPAQATGSTLCKKVQQVAVVIFAFFKSLWNLLFGDRVWYNQQLAKQIVCDYFKHSDRNSIYEKTMAVIRCRLISLGDRALAFHSFPPLKVKSILPEPKPVDLLQDETQRLNPPSRQVISETHSDKQVLQVAPVEQAQPAVRIEPKKVEASKEAENVEVKPPVHTVASVPKEEPVPRKAIGNLQLLLAAAADLSENVQESPGNQSVVRQAVIPAEQAQPALVMRPESLAVQLPASVGVSVDQEQVQVNRIPNASQTTHERLFFGERIDVYVQKGDLLRRQIADNRQPLKQALDEDICALIWSLTREAAEKGQEFEEGTYVISDPNRRLYDFLISNPKAYKRASTHFKERVKENLGLDLPNLPGDKKTLLFGLIDEGTDIQAVFIKPENYGVAHLVSADFVMHGVETLAAKFRKLIPGADDRDGYQKERVPYQESQLFAQIIAQFTRPVDQLKGSSEGIQIVTDPTALVLAQRDGLKYMHKYLQAAKHVQITDEQVESENQKNIASLQSLLDNYPGNIKMRTGREVLCTLEPVLPQSHKGALKRTPSSESFFEYVTSLMGFTTQ